MSKRGHRDPGVRHDLAVEVGRRLHAGVFGEVHHASAQEELEAFAYFERHRDKSYSIVDCLITHRFTARPGPRPK